MNTGWPSLRVSTLNWVFLYNWTEQQPSTTSFRPPRCHRGKFISWNFPPPYINTVTADLMAFRIVTYSPLGPLGSWEFSSGAFQKWRTSAHTHAQVLDEFHKNALLDVSAAPVDSPWSWGLFAISIFLFTFSTFAGFSGQERERERIKHKCVNPPPPESASNSGPWLPALLFVQAVVLFSGSWCCCRKSSSFENTTVWAEAVQNEIFCCFRQILSAATRPQMWRRCKVSIGCGNRRGVDRVRRNDACNMSFESVTAGYAIVSWNCCRKECDKNKWKVDIFVSIHQLVVWCVSEMAFRRGRSNIYQMDVPLGFNIFSKQCYVEGSARDM